MTDAVCNLVEAAKAIIPEVEAMAWGQPKTPVHPKWQRFIDAIAKVEGEQSQPGARSWAELIADLKVHNAIAIAEKEYESSRRLAEAQIQHHRCGLDGCLCCHCTKCELARQVLDA
jgi:hypothetical protein